MANPTSPSVEASLQGIPPELRNEIYRLVLVEPGTINVDENTKIPDLLKTCTTIENEASAIYFKENTFAFTIENFDASVYIDWCKDFPLFVQGAAVLSVEDASINDYDNFNNLEVWLEAAYNGECPWFDQEEFADDGEAAAANMHDSVRIMRDEGHMSWEHIYSILQRNRLTISAAVAQSVR